MNMEESVRIPWTAAILNKTRQHNERWRILSEGMGYCHEPENSPLRSFRIAKGMKRKCFPGSKAPPPGCFESTYVNQMSLLHFFQEEKAPLLVRKNARDWLVANGYTDWLKSKNLFIIEK
jgi:hypothetical protein